MTKRLLRKHISNVWGSLELTAVLLHLNSFLLTLWANDWTALNAVLWDHLCLFFIFNSFCCSSIILLVTFYFSGNWWCNAQQCIDACWFCLSNFSASKSFHRTSQNTPYAISKVQNYLRNLSKTWNTRNITFVKSLLFSWI